MLVTPNASSVNAVRPQQHGRAARARPSAWQRVEATRNARKPTGSGRHDLIIEVNGVIADRIRRCRQRIPSSATSRYAVATPGERKAQPNLATSMVASRRVVVELPSAYDVGSWWLDDNGKTNIISRERQHALLTDDTLTTNEPLKAFQYRTSPKEDGGLRTHKVKSRHAGNAGMPRPAANELASTGTPVMPRRTSQRTRC